MIDDLTRAKLALYHELLKRGDAQTDLEAQIGYLLVLDPEVQRVIGERLQLLEEAEAGRNTAS